jgi:hypothetical protein
MVNIHDSSSSVEFGQMLIILGAVLFVGRVLTYDPPSGYNMGTGDSMFPAHLAMVMVAVGTVLWIFG